MNTLYILPFDHRGSFMKMFGVAESALTSEATAMLADYKHVVYEGFILSLAMGVPKEYGAILVDEQFGAAIHKEAREVGITRILTIEKSGQDEFDFEYGDAYGDHIEQLKPEYVKALVRYNAEGDKEMNLRQAARLKRAGDFCKANDYKFLFELLAPATAAQKEKCGGSDERYEKELRGEVMRDGIRELQRAGIEPDIWKLEGLERTEQMQEVIGVARAEGRDHVGVVVLGRGESEEKVRMWLTVAAKIPGVVGFAVGRTVFKQPLIDLHGKKISRQEASKKIAENFKGFADLFSSARAS